MNTRDANTHQPMPTKQTEGSRLMRLVAFGLLALIINSCWLWWELAAVTVLSPYALCWYILIWALGSTVVGCLVGFGLTCWLEGGLKTRWLAGLILALLVVVCWAEWRILAPGLMLGALAGVSEQRLRALFLLLLAGCGGIYVANAAWVLALGSVRGYEAMQPGGGAAEVKVGGETWRGYKLEGPIPFFLPQAVLLLQINDGDIQFLYSGCCSTSPVVFSKSPCQWVDEVQQGSYYRLF